MTTLLLDRVFSEMYQDGLVISDDCHDGMHEACYFDSMEVEHHLKKESIEKLLEMSKEIDPDCIGLQKKMFMFDGCAPAEYWFYPKSKKAKEILQYEVEVKFVNRISEEPSDDESEFSDYEFELIENVLGSLDEVSENSVIRLQTVEFDDSTYFERLLDCLKRYYFNEVRLFLLHEHTLAACSLETYENLKNHFKALDLFVTNYYFVGGNGDNEWKFVFSDGTTLLAIDDDKGNFSFPDYEEPIYVKAAQKYLDEEKFKKEK